MADATPPYGDRVGLLAPRSEKTIH